MSHGKHNSEKVLFQKGNNNKYVTV